MDPNIHAPSITPDGRQSAAAAAIQRGSMRLLYHLGYRSLPEVTLKTGRRADLLAINDASEIWIIEIKSGLADFQADQKWPDYIAFADQFYFAVGPEFPVGVVPDHTGLIIADQFGAEIVRTAPCRPLPAARRKSLVNLVARTGADRLHRAIDPDLNSLS